MKNSKITLPKTTHVGDKNSKRKLVCLHGGTGLDFSYFLPYLSPLSEAAELIFYRQGDGGARNIDELFEEAELVIDSLGDSQIFLLGHSFGGALALEYAGRTKARKLKGLILVSWVYDKNWFAISQKKHAAYLSALEAKKSKEPLSLAQQFKEILYGYVPLYFTKEFQDKGREVLAKTNDNPELFYAIIGAYLGTFDIKENIRTLKLPTLSIAGDLDGIVDIDYVRAGLEENSRIETQEIKGTGHFPFIEKPEAFNALVQKFMK